MTEEEREEIVLQEEYLKAVKDRIEKEVNHPDHYTYNGIECIDIASNFDFCLGNVIKYIWRAGKKLSFLKEDEAVAKLRDLKKAQFYLQREISDLEKQIYKN